MLIRDNLSCGLFINKSDLHRIMKITNSRRFALRKKGEKNDFTEMGRRIKQCRKELKLTQAGLAEAIGLSSNHLSSVETGARKLSLEKFICICDKLQATPDSFLLGSTHRYNLPENLMDTLKLLLPEDVDFIMNTANLLIERNKEGNIAEHYLERIDDIKP